MTLIKRMKIQYKRIPSLIIV